LGDWVADVATALTPIGDELRREVVAATYLQTDDTTITVLDARGGSYKGRLWTYLDPLGPQVVFDATPTHEREGPEAFLATFTGKLQVDAYTGYDALYATGRVVEIGCWAHGRRRFVDAFLTCVRCVRVRTVRTVRTVPNRRMEDVRKQCYFRPSPQGLLAWDVDRLIELSKGFAHKRIPIEDLGELDRPWSGDGQQQTWRELIAHIRMIDQADLAYPVILAANGEVMDGRHRIAKAALAGRDTIQCVQFEEDPPPDHVGRRPEDLPYD
jgi:hypothetical protein